MGTWTYCDDCYPDDTTEATHYSVELWNGDEVDLCDKCYEERKKDGDLKGED